MAAAPKMPPEKWQQARKRWETDEREGYQWLITDMGLPVSAPAIRKKATAEGWKKRPIKVTKRAAEKALAKVTGEKPSQEIVETNEASVAAKDLDEFGSLGLTGKQELFVREYLTDFNAVKAGIRAGYSEETARSHAVGFLANPKIDRAIAILMRDRVQRMGREADELVKFHLAVIEFDPNELGEHRIHACRYCWGDDHAFQHSPSTWAKERQKLLKAWNKLSEEAQKAAGEVPLTPPDGWYQAKRGPNDDCPECHGVGLPVVKWKDTRHLSPVAKMLFAGVKEGKDGFEIVTLQKQKSLDTLSSHLGLNKVAEINVNPGAVSERAYEYADIMASARERQHKVLVERGLVVADVPAGAARVSDG